MSSWQPSAAITNLRSRAKILQQIRDFFAGRNVLEVETPILCHTSVTDPFIQSIPALFQADLSATEQRCYLQTSPEYAMKRLLAAGSGAIYQISKAFRQGEMGRFHNPEFSMLEWYRPGFDHHQLMNEMDELLQLTLKTKPAIRQSYADLFIDHVGIDPHDCTIEELKIIASQHQLQIGSSITDKDTWLQLLLSEIIEPCLQGVQPFFIYDFPVTQAALARIQPTTPPVASRFEVYVNGVELANGFHELQDTKEQRKRFEKNLLLREQLGLAMLPIDEYLLAALEHGLPDCAGVALGIDRLVMLATQSQTISECISFDFSRA
jgi:lysyl-tRNA synthetase class 2